MVFAIRAPAPNRDDRATPPALAEVRARSGGTLPGRLNQIGTPLCGAPAGAAAEARDAWAQAGRQGFVLGAGCRLLATRSLRNLFAARRAAKHSTAQSSPQGGEQA